MTTAAQTIEALRNTSAAGYVLRDSDTTDALSHTDLHVSVERYAEIIAESLAPEAGATGHVSVTYRDRPARRVYAQ